MQLETSLLDEALLITVMEERMDAAVAIQFKEAMREITEGAPNRVVLDLARVKFLDSSGLGAVIGAKKQIGEHKSMELAGLTPAVEKVFRLTRMDSIFTIHADVDDALPGAAHAC